MIVVAHRLATVQDADLIFVMGEGRVMERGSHAELLEQRGHYWQMVRSGISSYGSNLTGEPTVPIPSFTS